MAKSVIISNDGGHIVFFLNHLRSSDPGVDPDIFIPAIHPTPITVDDVRGKVVYGNNLPLFLAAAAEAVGVIEFTNDHYDFNFVMPGLMCDQLVQLGARVRLYAVRHELPLSWGAG